MFLKSFSCRWALILSLLIGNILYSQDSTNFFPHHVGDMWEYYFTDFIDDDTIQVFVTADSLDPNGNYHVVRIARSINPLGQPVFFPDSGIYIVDTLNQVLTDFSFGSGPLPMFKLDAQKGDQWVLWGYPGYYEMARVRDVFQDTLFGIPTTFKTYQYYLAADSTDTTGLARNTYILAEGFGIAFGWGEPGLYMGIRGAVIDGVLYGDTTLVSIHPNLPRLIPEQFLLYQNYPNPFNPRTTIPFILNRAGRISIFIYDVTGRLVKRLIDDKWYPVGKYEVIWDGVAQTGKQATSGVYLYRLQAGEFSQVRKMMLLK